MASGDINLNLNVLDKSGTIKSRTQEAKELNKELDKATSRTTGTRSGSMAAARAGFRDPGISDQEYNRGRGVTGSTGASARDFANQAQGLGGLVRLYATYAANLFAVSAAFTALRDAMDTTNMIKGLDQLGVATGRNLAQVSKELVKATDGAISLREAMAATAQASAAGMSDADIRKLGTAARGASVALGVSMGDALSRLSRGITKLEPELLDELGIFVRVDKAAEDYARTLGKTAAGLTEFERRQAFAVAVLDQANKKFGEIDIPANPYDQLLASLKNLMQSVLETVNVISPLITILSQSPTALAAGIAALSVMLVNKALPAVGQWRDQLRDAAENAAAEAKQNYGLYKDYMASNLDQAESRLKAHERALGTTAKTGMDSAIANIKSKGRIYDKELNALFKKDPAQITSADLATIDRAQKAANTRAAAATGTSQRDQNARARADAINAEADNLRNAVKAQVQYNDALTKAAGNSSVMAKAHQSISDGAQRASERMRALANAADNATFSGPINAFRVFNSTANKLDFTLGSVGRTLFKLRGIATITAATIGLAASAIGNVIGAITAVIGGIGLFVSAMGANSKQAAEAKDALDTLGNSALFMDKVFANLSKKDPLAQIGLDSLTARSSAVSSLSDNLIDTIDKVDREISTRNWADKLANSFFGLFGKSTEDILSRELSVGITSAINGLRGSSVEKTARATLAGILGISENSSAAQFGDAMEKANDSIRKLAAAELSKLTKQLDSSTKSAKNLLSSIDELNKQYDDFTRSIANESTEAKLAVTATKELTDFQKILSGDVLPAIDAIVKILDNPKSLRLFGQEGAQALIALLNPAKDLQDELAGTTSEITNVTGQLDNLRESFFKVTKGGNLDELLKVDPKKLLPYQKIFLDQYKPAFDALQKQLNESLTPKRLELEARFSAIADQVNKVTEKSIGRQIDVIFQQVRLAGQKVNISNLKAFTQPLQSTSAGISLQSKLDQRAIDLDIAQLRQSQSLVTALAENTLAIQRETASRTVYENTKRIEEERAKGPGNYDINLVTDLDRQRIAARDRLAALDQLDAARGPGGALPALSSANLKSLPASLQGALLPVASQAANISSQITAKVGEKQQIVFREQLDLLAESSNRALDKLKSDLEATKQKIDPIQLIADPEERAQKLAPLLAQQRDLEAQIQLEPARRAAKAGEMAASKIFAAPGSTAADMAAAQTAAQQLLDEANRQAVDVARAQETTDATEKRKTLLETINFVYTNLRKEDELSVTAQNQRLDAQRATVENAQAQLDIDKQQGKISDDLYTKRSNLLNLDRVSLQNKIDEAAIQQKRSAYILDSNQQIATANANQDNVEAKRLQQLQDATVQGYDIELALVQRNGAEKLKIAQQQLKFDPVLEQGLDRIGQAFEGVGDKILEFVQTGKTAFKDLFKSLLADLIRMELRFQMSKLWNSMLGRDTGGAGGGVVSALTKFGTALFTGGTSTGPAAGIGGASGADMSLFYAAKGGAFDYAMPVHQFADGGAFTNSIVRSPTMFKFAQGTGLMGEAGPEAIMPLTRDSSGTLGVRAEGAGQAPKVDVVVINNSGTPAQTKETTDARGNRRIEVMIGDMVAKEMNRPGSATQDTLRNTYNVQPNILRR